MTSRLDARLESADGLVATLKLDVANLPEIEKALASPARLPPIPALLAEPYHTSQLAERRLHNRLSIIIMAIIFDAFLLVQFKTAPEIAGLSAILRLLVLSPLAFAFIILDNRDRLGKFYGDYITALAVAPTLISDVLIVLTNASNSQSLSDIRATPLILMATGLVMRLTPREVVTNAVISVASFTPSVLFAACIPRAQDGALILSEIGVGAAAVMLTIQLESRDRRVFLLQISGAISRAALALRNRFLLAETQTDGLTGVANRRCFDESFASTWREACVTGGALGLIIIDIDNFKAFNDYYGHQGGDDCLRLVAGRASQEVRRGDLFARYGGEEFAVILPGTPLAAAVAGAERIRAGILALSLPHLGVGEGAIVTISLGVAVMSPTSGDDPRQLIEAADANLYAAKRGGRNQVGAGPVMTAMPPPIPLATPPCPSPAGALDLTPGRA